MNLKGFSFDVEAEIAHFRDPSTHTFFNTFIAPPPHTILGFIGSCLGYDELQVEKLGQNIQTGCIVKKLNGYLKDLAIVNNQKNQKDSQNIKTPRTRKFLIDPLYRIFVFCDNISLLEEILSSILKPKFVPYLGTSDCIAYIRSISKISPIKQLQANEIKSVVNLDKVYGEKKGNRFVTTIIDPKMLTVFPSLALCPTKYIISENGRQPMDFQRILMSVNCMVKFENPISIYQLSGDNIFPL
jgi:CRISPR-associated protein Cas5 subtype I-B